MAKFGIALEWGSRGPEFESQHSDHEKRLKFKDFKRFFFCPESLSKTEYGICMELSLIFIQNPVQRTL